jgi:uncharacterized protein YjbJ (UPF0337 family)
MGKDTLRGKWEELKGKVKKQWGHSTGDRKVQAEGTIQEGAGKVQKQVGKVTDEIKRA